MFTTIPGVDGELLGQVMCEVLFIMFDALLLCIYATHFFIKSWV